MPRRQTACTEVVTRPGGPSGVGTWVGVPRGWGVGSDAVLEVDLVSRMLCLLPPPQAVAKAASVQTRMSSARRRMLTTTIQGMGCRRTRWPRLASLAQANGQTGPGDPRGCPTRWSLGRLPLSACWGVFQGDTELRQAGSDAVRQGVLLRLSQLFAQLDQQLDERRGRDGALVGRGI